MVSELWFVFSQDFIYCIQNIADSSSSKENHLAELKKLEGV